MQRTPGEGGGLGSPVFVAPGEPVESGEPVVPVVPVAPGEPVERVVPVAPVNGAPVSGAPVAPVTVLHVVNDATIGGAQSLLVRLATSWAEHDSLHLVVLSGRGPMSPDYDRAFASVVYLNVTSGGRSLRALSSITRAALGYRRTIAHLRPGLINSHLLQSDAVAAFLTPAGIPVVSTMHTTGLSRADPVFSRILARIVGVRSGRFGAVIACTERCLDHTKALGYRCAVVVVENGTDVPAQASARYGEATTFLSLARWHPMKGHRELLAAFALVHERHAEWSLDLVGEGMLGHNPDLVRLIRELGLEHLVEDGSLRLKGPTTDPASALSGAGALVISSTYGEASPMAGIEAIAAGIPVIATRVGGSPALVASADLVAEPSSVAGLESALEAFVCRSAADRQALSDWSLDKARAGFSIERTVAGYARAYAEVTAPAVQSRASQSRAGQNSAAQNSAGQNSAAQNSAGQNNAGQNSAGQNNAAQNIADRGAE